MKTNSMISNKPALPVAFVLPVTLTVDAMAKRRTDLPDYWTAELGLADGKVIRRHFRKSEEDGELEDVTDLVTDLLLDRARSLKTAERSRQAEQVGRVGVVTPERLRRDRGEIVEEGTMRAGQVRARAVSSLDTLNQRKLLTMRQHEGGDRLAQDIKVMSGAKESRDDAAPPIGSISPDAGRCWEDFAVSASRRFHAARAAVQQLPAFEGVTPWSVIDHVVIQDGAITELSASHARSVMRRYKVALRMGLDRIADTYGLRDNVLFGRVFHDRIPRELLYREDRDGPDQNGEARIAYRSVTLNGVPWVEAFDTWDELYDAARKHLRALDASGS